MQVSEWYKDFSEGREFIKILNDEIVEMLMNF